VLAFITCVTFICFGVNTEENHNEIERGKKKKKEKKKEKHMHMNYGVWFMTYIHKLKLYRTTIFTFILDSLYINTNVLKPLFDI